MTTAAAPNLLGLTPEHLAAVLAELGEPRYRAGQIFQRLHRHRARDPEEWTEVPRRLREALREAGAAERLEVRERALSADGAEKVILGLPAATGRVETGGREIEAVWIPGTGARRTVCVSCQLGCTLDCTFCATGTLPFRGNLEAWQIVDQVYALERLRGERATNVVFMGMGEPFHNYDGVLVAAHLLHHPEGAGIGARHVTISTAGITPGVERFTEERQPFNLAISLNHPDPERRAEIMPITRRHPLPELLEAARRYTVVRRRRITFEYVMMPGVNMSRREVRLLAAIGRTMRAKLNLIPLNTALEGTRRPTPAEAAAFRRALQEAGLEVFDRGSPGREVGGACGMLALQRRGGEATPEPLLV